MYGKNPKNTVNSDKNSFFHKLESCLKNQNSNERPAKHTVKIICKTFPGFFIFITIFLNNEKILFKIQYITRPLGDL